MTIKDSPTSVLTVLAVAALMCVPIQASAVDRDDGDHWAYSMAITVPGFDIAVTGEVRYEFVSRETLTIEGSDVPVNVMRMTGSAAGSLDLIDLEASMIMEGYAYEGLDDISLVKSDITCWTNLTLGSGSYSLPMNLASRMVITYSPPLMSGFDPGVTAPGSTWVETTSVRTVSVNLTTGANESDESAPMTVTFTSFSELEEVSTGAGDFEALMITAAEDDGGRTLYWWSEEAGLIVKQETYVEGESQPVQTLLLEDYQDVSRSNVLVFLPIGALAAAVALALVVLVLVLMKRRPQRPGPDGSPPPELPPPPL